MAIEPNALFEANCLDLMQRMEAESVDLIYLDPPYLMTGQHADSRRSGQRLDEFENLQFVARVCQNAHRILRHTGVLFFHAQPISVFSVRLILSQIFGEVQFREEFIWQPEQSMPKGRKSSGRQHDSILYYAKSDDSTRNAVFRDATPNEIKRRDELADDRGRFSLSDLTVSGLRPSLQFRWNDIAPPGGRSWRFKKEVLEELERDGRIFRANESSTPKLKNYASERQGIEVGTIWTDIPRLSPVSRETASYPTQKPLGLMERLVLLGSNSGETVFDPFCGTGTCLVAAQRHGRSWIGCDVSAKAIEISAGRLLQEFGIQQRVINSTEIADIPLQLADFKRVAVSLEDPLLAGKVEFILNHEVPIEETRHFEFKEIRSPSGAVDSIVNTSDEYAVAFLNSEGGRVYWGIRDNDRVVVGVPLNYVQRDKVRRDVSAKLNQIEPRVDPSRFRIEIHDVRDEQGASIPDLCVVELVIPAPHSNDPYFTGGGEAWVKVDGAKQKLRGIALTEFIKARLNNS